MDETWEKKDGRKERGNKEGQTVKERERERKREKVRREIEYVVNLIIARHSASYLISHRDPNSISSISLSLGF